MLKFKSFDPESTRTRHRRPPQMVPGETVIRAKPLSRATQVYLRSDMVECTKKRNMQFSVAENTKVFAIRRDQ